MFLVSTAEAPLGILSGQKETLWGPPLLLWKRTTSPALIVSVAGSNLYDDPSSVILTSWLFPVPAGALAAGALAAGALAAGAAELSAGADCCSGAAVVP